MADNLETMGNFSIQDTMEMGMGNQELLQGLFEPETASSNPEDVTPIIKDADTPAAPEAPAVQKVRILFLLKVLMVKQMKRKQKDNQ
jgi:hypothetical protein